ncbi:MAG: carboxypeptidase regulatory-like domain-containing protein [bacterium]
MHRMRVAWAGLVLAAFVLVLNGCKNPDGNRNIPQPPPTGGIPGSGEDHSGDQSGQNVGFNFTPFRPQPNGSTTEPNSTYTDLVDVAISHWPEHGEVVLVMDGAGVHIFNSFGQEVLFNGNDTGSAVGDFPPFTQGYSIMHLDGSSTIWTMDNRVLIQNPFNFTICDGQTSIDFWNDVALGPAGDPLITQIFGPVFDGASGGNGPLGFEWDIYGNLWVRSSKTTHNPFADCQEAGPCTPTAGGCAAITFYIRGAAGPNCTVNFSCGVVNTRHPWGVMGTTFDTSRVDYAMTCSPDFDFSSTNQMVLSDFCNNNVVWTQPIPDMLQFAQQQVPPPPIEMLFQRGNIGANTGPVNDHMHFPWGIMIDRRRDDHVFIADTLNNRMLEYDIQGNYIKAYISGDESLSRGSTNRQFVGPVSMRMDSFDRMFVVDRGTDPATGAAVEDLYFLFRKDPVPSLPGDIQGQVVDGATNLPLLGAVVVLQNLTGNTTASTDSNGRFNFNSVIPGHRSIIVSKDGYFPSSQEFDVGPGEIVTLTVRLTPRTGTTSGAVSGRVVDAQTGVPLDGALVIVRDTGQRDFSSGGGRFFIPGIPPGIHALDFSAIGYESASRVVTIVAGVNTEIGDVDLRPNISP